MKLSFLLCAVGLACRQPDAEISQITDDPAAARPGSVFVCIRGARFDGHEFAAAAVKNGAAAVVAESPVPVERSYLVSDSRLAFSRLSAAFYGQPDKRLRLIGITGTNGKTTVAMYLRDLLQAAGARCATLGTLGFSAAGETLDTGYTTPKSDLFFSALQTAADRGCGYAAAEISSQALAQRRVDGARFYLGIMTNVGRDHLDYHGDVDALVAAKTRLCALSENVLVNADDPRAPDFYQAARAAGAKLYTYACASSAAADAGGPAAAFTVRDIRENRSGADFMLCRGGETYPAHIGAPGLYSVYNALAAFSAAVLCGVPPLSAAGAIRTLRQPPGRAQTIEAEGVRVCVDYAHTPDALAAILKALEADDGKKPIAVFGCGGDRDRGKRPMMGSVAAQGAAAVVLTSDNPRSEDPAGIIRDVAEGIPPGTRLFYEPDRGAAIRLALELAKPGDTVLIAGKGHETYQLVKDGKLPFSDMETVRRYFSEHKKKTN